MAVKQDDREDIIEAIKFAKGNITEAAKILNISRPTFYAKIKNFKGLKEQIKQLQKEFKKQEFEDREAGKYAKKYTTKSRDDREENIVIYDDKNHFLSIKMQDLLVKTKGKYTSIYSLAFDQLSMRELMTATKKAYHEKKITFKTYAYLMNSHHTTYAKLTQINEKIAQGMIDGKTADERLSELKNYLTFILETIKDIVNDLEISRQDIPAELIRRIRKATERD